MDKEKEPQEEYSFIQETIKDERTDKRKRRNKIFRTASLGLIFGLSASLGFFALKPLLEKIDDTETKTVQMPTEEADQETEEANTEVKKNPKESSDSSKKFNESMKAVAQQAKHSVVEVTGIMNDAIQNVESITEENSVAGVIIADNGKELLILTDSSIISEAQRIEVTFFNQKTYKATIVRRDATLGLAIVSVKKSQLPKSIRKSSPVAKLGSVSQVGQGDMVIAIGQPFGYKDGEAVGIISSTKEYMTITDGKYRLISTDIACTSTGTGILVDMSGKIIGYINQRMQDTSKRNVISALYFMNISKEIEDMSNDIAIPYLGIQGIEVNGETAENNGLEKGIYITRVEMDSPAMKAGIQNGDIIKQMDGNEIITFRAFRKVLLESKKGASMSLKGLRRGNKGYEDISFRAQVGSSE